MAGLNCRNAGRESYSFRRNRRCRWRRSSLHSLSAAKGHTKVAPSTALRRAFIFVGTAAMTAAGCYEMYEVVQVGGVTVLEWMVLACSSCCSPGSPSRSRHRWLASWCCCSGPGTRSASIRRAAPDHRQQEMQCCCRPTTKIPIASWPACGRCTESVDQSGRGSSFDWVCVERYDRPIGMDRGRRNASCSFRLDLGVSNIYYRHRRENVARKSGNIEDWIKRFGGGL